MNHTYSLQVPVTKRYKQVLCHSTDYNTPLFSLIAKFYDFPTWDVFERRGCDCYIRARTMDDCLPLLFVVSEPTLHVSHWPHHTESIILQQTLIHIPSWLSRWLTRFVLTTAHNCYIQNVHYETLSVKTMYIKYLKYYS